MRNVRAVALRSIRRAARAAQSHLIFRRIRALADEKKVPVIAFVEDVAASGGYMIACAADEIVADLSSIVGSIGVVGGSFGFAKLIEKIGVERRLYTSGEQQGDARSVPAGKAGGRRAAQGDPARNPRGFIALVKSRRGAKLDGPENALFSGEYWTGQTGPRTRPGRADRRSAHVLRERYGEKVRDAADRRARLCLFGRRVPGVGRQRSTVERTGPGRRLVATLEARAIWSRYGL